MLTMFLCGILQYCKNNAHYDATNCMKSIYYNKIGWWWNIITYCEHMTRQVGYQATVLQCHTDRVTMTSLLNMFSVAAAIL